MTTPDPPHSIPIAEPALLGNEARYVADCIETGWISSLGPYISRFEEEFAKWCGVRAGVACNNGTSALHLTQLALGVGPGDEVLVPTLTYVATANAVRYCGATPVFVESDPLTMNIDPVDAEARITPRTVGIIPVHLYGQPADMDALREMAERRGLWIVEDAAEAHGAKINGASVGTLGTLGVFSFFGNKILTTGEGGMVLVDDPELERRLRLYERQGQQPDRRYWFPVIGNNYRMTNIQAAIGLAQLEQFDHYLAYRLQLARWYTDALEPVADLLDFPAVRAGVEPVTWLFTVVLREDTPISRAELAVLLAAEGIDTRPVFSPVHALPPYATEKMDSFPVAERLGRNGLSLPTSVLRTQEDVEFVASRVTAHLSSRNRAVQ